MGYCLEKVNLAFKNLALIFCLFKVNLCFAHAASKYFPSLPHH